MDLLSIKEEWESYAKYTFHITKIKPDSVQYKEMQKAFFAGAMVMLSGVRRVGEDDVSEQAALNFLQSRWQELQEFGRKIISDYTQTN